MAFALAPEANMGRPSSWTRTKTHEAHWGPKVTRGPVNLGGDLAKTKWTQKYPSETMRYYERCAAGSGGLRKAHAFLPGALRLIRRINTHSSVSVCDRPPEVRDFQRH